MLYDIIKKVEKTIQGMKVFANHIYIIKGLVSIIYYKELFHSDIKDK